MVDPIDLYYGSARADLEEFGSRFTDFSKTAYRFELLPSYSVPEEEVALSKFLGGQSSPSAEFNSEWHGILDAAERAGKRFSRTRIVTAVTPYLEFEIAWGYSENVKHGELINIVQVENLECIAAAVPILCDFWLFDRLAGYLMAYDAIGRFLGVHRIPEHEISPYNALMDRLANQGMNVEAAKRMLST